MAYIITVDNYPEAEAATRDILYMYRDLIRSYRGFGHNIDTGTFDPSTFVDAGLYEEPCHSLAMEMSLIHQGSAVALLCRMSDLWDEIGSEIVNQTDWGKEWRKVLKEGRLDHLPLAKAALMAGFDSEEKLRSLLPTVYTDYIEGYFHRLLQEGHG
ncbi:hypothetical protein IAD21_05024 [Abditibacteriota bacterium]|nr:hypothetical protein IAD21_05024 [Abditibacteriota bacterium]